MEDFFLVANLFIIFKNETIYYSFLYTKITKKIVQEVNYGTCGSRG